MFNVKIAICILYQIKEAMDKRAEELAKMSPSVKSILMNNGTTGKIKSPSLSEKLKSIKRKAETEPCGVS